MADSRTLQILIEAKNNATKELGVLGKQLKGLEPDFKSIRNIGVGMFASIAGSIGLAVSKTGEFEQTQIAFATMLGSEEKAYKLLQEMTEFAKTTPFELAGLEDQVKKLLAYGIEQENVIATTKMLGDISAGVGMDKLGNLTLAFGQVKAATKLTGNELRQFTEAGVPLLDALAKTMGKTKAEIQGMVSDGKIGFPQVQKALSSLTEEGGLFFNLMGKQSKTLNGLISNLQDEFNIFLRDNGALFIDLAKDIIVNLSGMMKGIADFTKNNQELIKILVPVGLAMGAVLTTVGLIGLTIPKVVTGVGLLKGAFIALRTVSISLSQVGLMAIVTALAMVGNTLIQTRSEVANWGDTWKVVGLSIMSQTSKLSAWVVEKWGQMLNAVGQDGQKYIDQAKGMRTESEYLALEAQNIRDEFAEQAKQIEATTNATAEMANTIPLVVPPMQQAEEQAKDMTDSLQDLRDEYKDLQLDGIKSIKELTNETVKNLQDLQADFGKTVKSIQELQKEYQKGLVSDQQSVAEEIIATEEKIADMKREIEEKKKDIELQKKEKVDDKNKQSHNDKLLQMNNELEQLQAKLDKEQQALKDSADFQLTIQSQIDEARRVSNLTDLQRAIENYNNKRKIAEQEFSDKVTVLIKEIEAIKLKESQEIELYKAKTDQIRGLMLKANAEYKKGVQDNLTATEQAIKREIELYRQLASAISSSAGASSATGLSNAILGTRATGGPINQTGIYKLHEGEYVVPKNQQTSGQSIVVNINGGTYLSEDVAEEMGDKIINRLKTQLAI